MTFTTHSFLLPDWIFFQKFFWTFFSMLGNFLTTPPNPIMMKILKNCPKTDLIAQKKRLDALNETQKPQLLTKYGSWKNEK